LTFEASEGSAHARATVVPELCTPGTDIPRASVLVTFADIASGMIATQISPDRVPVTVDLAVRILARPGFGPVALSASLLKAGRSTLVAEIAFASERVAGPWAVAVATFMASPRPVDVFLQAPPLRGGLQPDTRPTLPSPIAERVGVELVTPGHARLEHRQELSNATNTMQGGLIALIGEVAAESLAGAAGGGPYAAHDLDVRYLRAARVGPAFTVGQLLHHDESEATARVEVRDAGADDRLVALVTARCVKA
jgi:acyl-coenzyme A thioesterase PaaI-like protein